MHANHSAKTDPILTISQAAHMLGVSEATLRQWTDEGRIDAFVTPGGHRRYSGTALRQFMGLGNRVHGIKDLIARMELTPEQELQIAKAHFTNMTWYKHLDPDSRDRLRELGRRIHDLVISYISRPAKREDTLQMAKNVGTQFGKALVEMGIPLTDSLEAFILHRLPLVTAAADLMRNRKPLNERAAEAIPLVTRITDEVLFSLVSAYQNSEENTNGDGSR